MATKEDEEHLHPAHAEGVRAFGSGLTYEDCPYEYGTDEYNAWRQGWQEGLSAEFK